MAATTAPATTADLRAMQEQLARFVHANFGRKLSLDDAYDAAADALFDLERALAAGREIHNPHGWLRRAVWNKALDQVRAIEGEGPSPRQRPLDIDDFGAMITDVEHEDVPDAHGRAADARALARAWTRLKPDEQRAIHLRYHGELSVEEVLNLLGCSRHHYENLTKRGLRRLREALVQTVADRGCRACRALTVQAQDRPLLPEAAIERDAHLSGCLPCRAFARRQAGLMAALPLPAAGFIDRVSAYLGARFGNGPGLAQHGEAAAGVTVAAGATGASATAVGGGTAATSFLGGAGAVKVAAVVCGASAVTAAVCVPPPPKPASERSRPAKIAEAAPNRTVKPPALKTAPAVAAAAQVDQRAQTPTTLPGQKPEPATRRRKPDKSAPPRDASPFLPESAAAPPSSSPDPTPTATSASTSIGEPSAPRSPASSSPPPSADFSQEFTP